MENYTEMWTWFQIKWKGTRIRSGSRAAVTSKMEHFVIIANGFLGYQLIYNDSFKNMPWKLENWINYLS